MSYKDASVFDVSGQHSLLILSCTPLASWTPCLPTHLQVLSGKISNLCVGSSGGRVSSSVPRAPLLLPEPLNLPPAHVGVRDTNCWLLGTPSPEPYTSCTFIYSPSASALLRNPSESPPAHCRSVRHCLLGARDAPSDLSACCTLP